MSLDVYLTTPAACPHCGGALSSHDIQVFWSNITHNLGKMAAAAGIYDVLWRPDENGVTKAGQLVEPLKAGLAKLKETPDEFKIFNAPNGWGLYEHFIPWVEAYLAACEKWPEALVTVSR